jgi:diketogulonate reductase-like aldo/keto reductase
MTREIPGTGEQIPVCGLGSSGIFNQLPAGGKEVPISVIRTMVELGGKLVDTPAFLGQQDPVIGSLISEMGIKDDLFLASKVTVGGKAEGIAHLERVARTLGKNPIDVLMVHNMGDMANQWPTLKEWKETGRVRYIGVSQTTRNAYGALEQFINAEKPDFIQVNYSIQEAQSGERILPTAADNGVAVMTARPFSNGRYFGLVGGKELPAWVAEFDCESWAQFSLKYILSNPAVTCSLSETSKTHHVVDNMRAGYGRLPDEPTRQRMHDYLWSL